MPLVQPLASGLMRRSANDNVVPGRRNNAKHADENQKKIPAISALKKFRPVEQSLLRRPFSFVQPDALFGNTEIVESNQGKRAP
jgi:hypothetical protein